MLGAPYKTKKDLKSAVGKPLRHIETSLFGQEYVSTGQVCVVGPCPYTNRKWYARVTLQNDVIIGVK